MSREKQIEEMVKELSTVWIVDWEGNPHELHEKLWNDDLENIAIELYNLGYRKQSVGEWLLIKVPTGVEAYGIREVQAYPKCSICAHMGDVSEWHFKYCPNCGASMKGGAE